jgi:hypothetical protein
MFLDAFHTNRSGDSHFSPLPDAVPNSRGPSGGGHPIGAGAAQCYRGAMNPLLLIIVLVLLFGGGGFYMGGPAYGGGGLGLVLFICLIVYLMGGWRTKS